MKKKYYRVNVPAIISFDVAAESEEHAKRLAAAAVYTPVTSLLDDLTDDSERVFAQTNLALWSRGNDLSGDLDGSKVEIVDSGERSEEEINQMEAAAAELAHILGNDDEFSEAIMQSVSS